MTEAVSTYQANQVFSGKTGKALSSQDKEAKNLAKAKEAAEDFEAFFMTRMMESMYEGVSTDGMFGGGHAEKIYRSMLLTEYGKIMAKTGTIGISDSIMDSIIQMQEAQSAAAH